MLPRLLKKGGYKNSKGGGGEEQWVNVGSWGKIIGAPRRGHLSDWLS